MRSKRFSASIAICALLLASCGGGGGGSGASPAPSPSPSPTPTPATLYVAPPAEALSIADVQAVIARTVAEANARGKLGVVAVVDRVGNVLGVFKMNSAQNLAQTPFAPDGTARDAQNLSFAQELGAIAKAVTGAYLSSGGNAFSTRTASMILQEHFPPAPTTAGLESGPLFGVQFSQLPCSDLMQRFGSAGGAASIGPKRSPLGLSADPGGFPLYKNGVLVGGIGFLGDQRYGFDPNILDNDNDPEEAIALAGTRGYEAPDGIRADRIYIDGTQLRYSDAGYADLQSGGSATFASTGSLGSLIAVRGYASAVILAGTPYGTEASGFRPARTVEFANVDAFILSDGAGNNRFPLRGGQDTGFVAQPLTQGEATAILEEAFKVMGRTRAQIRQPLQSRAQVSISLVDTRGNVLGLVRSPDAPIFGTDVSLQKARTATFFSSSTAGTQLLGDPDPGVAAFVDAVRVFFADPTALTGAIAFTDRANGNISRPFFPDGEVGRPHGPLSRPIQQWSPFSTGLQSALIAEDLVRHARFVAGVSPADTPQRCTSIPDAASGSVRLGNGIQIFPGSVPIYRGNVLVGGLGVSGDGIDQDDMISFLGLSNGGLRVGTIGNAPKGIRADTLLTPVGAGTRLRYIRCPVAPFLAPEDTLQNVCEGL